MNNQQQKRWEDLLSFSALCLLVILVNIYAEQFFFRLDLTEGQRYSIAPATEEMLSSLGDDVYIDVYLAGDLNAQFQQLRNAIEENLREFRIAASGRVHYQFIDPNDAPSQQARQEKYQQLVAKGLPPTTLFDVVEGERKQKVIFPGAIVSYAGKERAVLLLKGNKAASPAQQINQSMEGVEYELAATIAQLATRNKKRIAFTTGQGEADPAQLGDALSALSGMYAVDFVDPASQSLEPYEAVVVAKPVKPFSELAKFHLDQYVVKGGNALFLLDRVQMNLDSIPMGGTYAFGYDLNIEDLLFRFGVRVNTDLLQDLQMANIEMIVGNFGNQPNLQQTPWPYYVYLNTFSKHPIVRNLDAVLGKFVSTIDTVKAEGIRKTPLIVSSQYSRRRRIPNMVALEEVREVKEDRELFNQEFLPVAMLLEGSFTSLYANRFPPRGIEAGSIVGSGQPAKVVVVGDGDLVISEINPRSGKREPIDFDRLRQQPLSNKEFLLNTLAYLTSEDGLITARNKQITMRPLDKVKLRQEQEYWQLLNIAGPIVLVLLFGFLRNYLRKRHYQRR